MRTFKIYILVLLLAACASTSLKANTPPALSTDQPLTMDQVLDRVISNEQDLYDQMRNYSPLVETYIQNLKADKDLGEVPAGDKYFLGRANFQNGINLVPLTDTSGMGKKALTIHARGFAFLRSVIRPCGWEQQHHGQGHGYRASGGPTLDFPVHYASKNKNGHYQI